MRVVDLRSDTVTLPTEEMLEAIRHAPLGDDVFGEDPTVNKLQEMAADKLGKEEGLLVTTGTQGNLVSLLSQTKRGDEIILEANSHIFHYEVGGLAAIGGLMARTVPGRLGYPDPKDVEAAVRPKDIHCPETTLIALENTHNRAGGTVITPQQTKAMADLAKKYGIRLHIDGARIFNAAVALGVDVKRLAGPADSVTFCLSKGLSCPVGSVIVGSHDFIERARRMRKILGGGMRQAGIIAAPGIVALEKMIDRLRDDHANARRLAEGLLKIQGISVNMETVQTNIVYLDVAGTGATSNEFSALAEERGVKSLPTAETVIRMVTHYGIEKNDIDYALQVINEVAEHIRGKRVR
jgi:threonine aldolase